MNAAKTALLPLTSIESSPMKAESSTFIPVAIRLFLAMVCCAALVRVPAQGNGAGAVDSSFAPLTDLVAPRTMDADISSIAIQPDGKIVVGGAFTSILGVNSAYIARLNQDGSVDPSFMPGTLNSTVNQLVIQPDGRIVIVGAFTQIGTTSRYRVARLNANGTLDSGFNPGSGANDVANAVVLRSDGKILIGGAFAAFNGIERQLICLLNADGSFNASFDFSRASFFGQVVGAVNTLALRADGRILVGGDFQDFVTPTDLRWNILGLNADGSLDTTFLNLPNNPNALQPDMFGSVKAVAVQSDGKVLLAGDFTLFGSVIHQAGIARLQADGSFDTGFDPGAGASSGVSAVLIQPDGKIVMCGGFSSVGMSYTIAVARLDQDGSADTSFTSKLSGPAVHSICRQNDGKILVGGKFRAGSTSQWVYLARLLGVPGPASQANLVPYNPPGWSGKVVVSKTTGTTNDTSLLTTADTLYMDVGIANTGNADALGFYTSLFVDGVLRTSWYWPSLTANHWSSEIDYPIGALSAGTHTLSISVDSTSVVSESNESDNSHSRAIVVSQPGPGTILWTFDLATLGGVVGGCPAIGRDGMVFAPVFQDLVALNGRTGEPAWKFSAVATIVQQMSGGPAMGPDGTIYVGAQVKGDYKVYALDPATGAELWAFTAGGRLSDSPVVGADGRLYACCLDRKVYALDPKTGTNIWAFATGTNIPTSAAIGADGTLYVGSFGGTLYALNASTGSTNWVFTTGADWDFSPAAIGTDGTIYVGAYHISGDSVLGGKVYALDSTTGAKRWEFAATNTAPIAVGSNGTVYVVGAHLYALDGPTGSKKWEFNSAVGSAPTIGADGTVYVGSGGMQNKLYALDGNTGLKLWEADMQSELASPITISTNGTLYFETQSGYIYAVLGNSTNGLATSGWAKYHRDMSNSGQAVTSQAPSPVIVNPSLRGDVFSLRVATVAGAKYVLEHKNGLAETVWTIEQSLPGIGGSILFTNEAGTNRSRFFRIRLE